MVNNGADDELHDQWQCWSH